MNTNNLLADAMAEFAQKKLGLEQPVIAVAVTANTRTDETVKTEVLAKGTLRELSAKYSLSLFGPVTVDMANPLVMIAYVDESSGIVYDHRFVNQKEYEILCGKLPE